MPDFKDPRTGWVFIVRGIVEDFELKPVLNCHSEYSRTLKN